MKKQALIISLVVLGALTTMAQPPRDGRPPQNERGTKMDKMTTRLELSEDQQVQLEQAMIAHHKAVKPLRNQLEEKRAALKTLSSAEKVDQEKLNTSIDEIGDLQTAMLKAKVNHQIAMRAMLTDKQKMLFDQMQEQKKHGKGGRSSGGSQRG